MKTFIRSCLLLALTMASAAHADAMAAAYLGTPAEGTPFVRRIEIGPAARWINVRQDETVQLVNEAGETFTWKFDTAQDIVPLARVAPPAFLHGRHIDAYVMRPPASG